MPDGTERYGEKETELAHDIMDEKRFVSYKQIAWHGLGTVFTERITASAAARLAGLDFPIELVPVIVPSRWGEVPSNAAAIVRGPTDTDDQPVVFGMATTSYQIVSNLELAEMLDPLTEAYPVETAGALGNGETVFYCLDAGEFQVAGEEMRGFFLLTDTRDGASGLDMCYTPVRVRCRNTLRAGLSAARVSARLTHASNLRDDLALRLKIMAEMKTTQERMAAMMGQMAMSRLVTAQVEAILEYAYPTPRKPGRVQLLEQLADDDPTMLATISPVSSGRFVSASDRYEWLLSRTRQYRLDAALNYQRFNDEQPSLADTPWALYNAVVECEDRRKGSTNPKAAPAGQSALFGDRARVKIRAWEACHTAASDALVIASN